MDVKAPGNFIYVVGNTYTELGGSHYFGIHGFIGNNAPNVVRPDEGKLTMERLSTAISIAASSVRVMTALKVGSA